MNKYVGLLFGIIFVTVVIVTSVYRFRTTWPIFEKDNISGQMIVGDGKDEHGCILSAGYSWCEEKKKCLRPWEESCGTPKTITRSDNWEAYKSEDVGISISYPSDMNIKENPNGTLLFIMVGPSQINNTEVYSGIIMNVRRGEYQENTLREYVMTLVDEKRNDYNYEEVTDAERVYVAGISGFKYYETSLGTFTNIYLPFTGTNEYLELSYLVEDPNDEGLVDTMDKMLKSLKLI